MIDLELEAIIFPLDIRFPYNVPTVNPWVAIDADDINVDNSVEIVPLFPEILWDDIKVDAYTFPTVIPATPIEPTDIKFEAILPILVFVEIRFVLYNVPVDIVDAYKSPSSFSEESIGAS